MDEDLETSFLVGKCPSQVGKLYVKPVSFQEWLIGLYGLLGGVFKYYTRTGWEVLPDKMVTVQDKTGSVSGKP